MDHHFLLGADGVYDGFEDKYYKGRHASCIYIPRFRNLGGSTDQKDFLRGYGFQGGAWRGDHRELIKNTGYGKDLKDAVLTPGNWAMGLGGFGEVLPYHENKISERIEHVSLKAKQLRLPFIYCNMIGGQEELIFDGSSFAVSKEPKKKPTKRNSLMKERRSLRKISTTNM